MRTKDQDSFSLAVKVALLKRGLTVSKLAENIGRARETVSRSIHQDRFPAVREQIREALSL